jgi:uncharacterized protein (TIGR00730 family)
MQKICVFCGSNTGKGEEYSKHVANIGKIFVKRKYHLVYGGGSTGLMGILANAVLEAGGEVTGVIPYFLLEKEVGHRGLTHMVVVDTMHARKQQMADLADGFIALPGGMGTMDELCEIITWAQLSIHQKPIGLLNVGGYFNMLTQFFDHMAAERFLSESNRKLVLCEKDPEKLLDAMEHYQPPSGQKWLDLHRT